MDRGYRRHLLAAAVVVDDDDDVAAVGRRRASALGRGTGRKWRNRRSCTTRWRWRCIRGSSRSPWPGSSASPANPPASCRRTSSPSNTASRSLRGEVFISLDASRGCVTTRKGGRARGVLFFRSFFHDLCDYDSHMYMTERNLTTTPGGSNNFVTIFRKLFFLFYKRTDCVSPTVPYFIFFFLFRYSLYFASLLKQHE